MVDRSVSIALEARVSGFVAGIRTAQTAVTGFTAQLEKSAAKRQALNDLGGTFGKIGLAAGAGLGIAIATAANFDQAMSRVQGATQDSAKQMELLRTAAINAGRDTVFSASDAASAEEELAKAGVSTADILGGGLKGALNLASAGTIDVGQAAEIAATTMNQFGLAGTDVTHIADVLAATAGKAQGDVTDMAEALKYVGPVASQMGVSLEQTAGTIGLLAHNGILGSQAGTSLRGMLTALTSPSKQAAGEMKTLGINVYDAQGKFVGFDGVAGQLHDKMSGLSNATRDQALGQLFGNQQITAARILYASGAGAVDQWTKKVNDTGYAAHLAGTKMNNLKGDLEQLKGSLETALIGTGQGAQGPLRSIVRGLTDVVNAYTKLPPAAQNATAGLLGITAVTGGGLWFGAKVLGGIADTRKALTDLGETAPRTASALGKLGTAAAIAGGVLILRDAIQSLEDSMAPALPTTQELAGKLLDLSNTNVGSIGKQFDDLSGSLDYFQKNTNTVSTVVGKLTGWAPDIEGFVGGLVGFKSGTENVRLLKDQFTALDSALASIATSGSATKARQAFASLAASQHLSGAQQKYLLTLLPQYRDALAGAGNQAKVTGADSKVAADGITGVGGAASDATPKLKTFKGALADINGFLDKRQAWRDYQQSIDDWKKSIKQTGPVSRQSLNDMDAMTRGILSVAQGMHKANRVDFLTSQIHMLEEMASKSPAAARALGPIIDHLYEAAAGAAHATGMQKQLIEQYHLTPKQAATVIKQIGMGKSQADIRDLLKQFGLTPKQIATAIKLLGDGDAINGLKRVADASNHLDSMIANPNVKVDGVPKSLADLNSVSSKFGVLDHLSGGPTATVVDHASNVITSIIERLNSLNGRTSTSYIRTVEIHSIQTQHVSTAGGRASGGYITGPGTPTSDSIPAWLSTGEYVMKAAAVDKYGVNMMHRINALGFAGGGQVGGSPTHGDPVTSEVHKARQEAQKRHAEHMAALRKQLGATQKQLDAAKKQLDAAKQFNQSVQQNFRVDPFANNATLQGVMASLQSDTHRTREFSAAARNAKHLGLDGGVFRALLASGDTSVLEGITTRSQVKALEAAWRARNRVTADLTFGAGTSGRFAGDSLEHLGHVIDKLRHDLRHLHRDVRDGAEKGTRKGTRDNRGHRNRAASRANLP